MAKARYLHLANAGVLNLAWQYCYHYYCYGDGHEYPLLGARWLGTSKKDVIPPKGWNGPEDDARIEAEFRARKRARMVSSDRSNVLSVPEVPSDDNSMDISVQGSEAEELNVTPVVDTRGIPTSELRSGVEQVFRPKEMPPPAAPPPPLRTALQSMEDVHAKNKNKNK